MRDGIKNSTTLLVVAPCRVVKPFLNLLPIFAVKRCTLLHGVPVLVILVPVTLHQPDVTDSGEGPQTRCDVLVPLHQHRVDSQVGTEAGH